MNHQANLVSIGSAEEHQFVVGLNGGDSLWLGGRRDSANRNNWVWSDGTPWGYKNWFPGRPKKNRDCVMLTDGLWVDNQCWLERAFVCRKGNTNYQYQLPLFKKSIMLGNPGQNIERNKELAFIESWGPLFSVSFDLFITSFENEAWSDILAFKANGAISDFAMGDRIPAIFLHKTGYIWFVNLINGEDTSPAAKFKVDIEFNQWYSIALQQIREDDKVRGYSYRQSNNHLFTFWQVLYLVYINGNEVHQAENTDARTFKDVRLFASADVRPPAKARYRNLVWSTRGCQAGWSEFMGKCYKVFLEPKNWDEAKNECVQEKVRRCCKNLSTVYQNDLLGSLCLYPL